MRNRSPLTLSVLVYLSAVACSSSSSPESSVDGGGGGDSGTQVTDSGADSTVASNDGGADSSSTQDSAVKDSSVETFETSVADAGTGAVTGLQTETWTWVPFPNSTCRDGSSTGIGLNVNPASDKVMVFMEGGYACFNSLTCSLNPESFGESDFAVAADTGPDGGTSATYSLNTGILDRTQATNPVKDWNFVYIPYCSGDIHAGANATAVPGWDDGGVQKFAGYANVTAFLSRVVPTFPTASQVLLAGMSAGGFGAAANYVQVADAFGSVPVVLLDDSGPFMEDPYLSTCLQNNLRSLWGLDSTVGVECGDAGCQDQSRFFLDYAKTIISARPNTTFGLIEGSTDGVISLLFGYGADSCNPPSLAPEPGATFTAGLQDIRTQLAGQSNFGAYIYDSSQHTAIQDSSFYSITVPSGDAGAGVDAGAQIPMAEWVSQLIAGSATNAGP